MLIRLIFFFMHKTADDVRISDWSSDVCSSDLWRRRRARQCDSRAVAERHGHSGPRPQARRTMERRCPAPRRGCGFQPRGRERQRSGRSEEHTSELQSLMRISYAVFCLKKKKTKKTMVVERERSLKRKEQTERQE